MFLNFELKRSGTLASYRVYLYPNKPRLNINRIRFPTTIFNFNLIYRNKRSQLTNLFGVECSDGRLPLLHLSGQLLAEEDVIKHESIRYVNHNVLVPFGVLNYELKLINENNHN